MQSISTKSIVFYNGSTKRSSCGYCKKENSSFSNGMWASSLSVGAYQDMIDRGWRRAGKYCYKALMEKTCCPLYTIRCEALNNELSKSQKKIIKRVTTFLKHGECEKNPVNTEQAEREPIMKYKLEDIQNHDDKMKITNTDYLFDEEQSASVIDSPNSTLVTTNKEDNKMVVPLNLSCNSDTKKETKKFKPGEGADPNLPSSKKKKLLRIQKKLSKDPNFVPTISAPYQKSLEEFIAENDSVSTGGLQKLRLYWEDRLTLGALSTPNVLMVRRVPSYAVSGLESEIIKLLMIKSTSNSFEDEYAVYQKYQTVIHGDEIERCSRQQFIQFLINSPLKVSLVKTGTEAFAQTFTAGATLFAKYQIAVHNDKADECNMEQYLSFLVDSPLKEEKSKHPDHPGYGSFHQQYWLGDKLIAVGVIDILPKCVSSVYLFYDPDYHNLVLGTYSSLREICLVRQLYKMSPDLKYYYMGFYIHSCSKMRYKAKFRPSYLLCPLKYTWHAIDKCIQKLDNEKYSIFDVSGDIQDADNFTIDNIPVLYRGSLMPYSAFKIIGNDENEDERIKEYKILIGPKLARKLIYCIMD